MSIDRFSQTALQILGGGPAGLAVAYYGRKAGRELVLFEGADNVGGNARTLRLGDCLFDTGAHRFHDKIPVVTEEIRSLLGEDLMSVRSPSRIQFLGNCLRFPLQPRDLFRQLPLRTLARIIIERLGRGRDVKEPSNFHDWAIHQYGETLANLFLLNYSEKLWGEDTRKLSTDISGGRLRNLDLRAFLRSLLPGDDSRHLDGEFLYPKLGFGTIFDRVSEEVGIERIRCGNRITRMTHEDGRIRSVELNGTSSVVADTVISTLPLPLTVRILDPKPPESILEAAKSFRFRKLLLCVFCLKRTRFSENASIYFPDPNVPFTRLYECKNRSPFLAPEDQTAIVLELPCHESSPYWRMDESELLKRMVAALNDVKTLGEEEVLNAAVYRLPFAYPILEIGVEDKVNTLSKYLSGYENLHLLGRNATFRYLHTHDLFLAARDLIEGME